MNKIAFIYSFYHVYDIFFYSIVYDFFKTAFLQMNFFKVIENKIKAGWDPCIIAFE